VKRQNWSSIEYFPDCRRIQQQLREHAVDAAPKSLFSGGCLRKDRLRRGCGLKLESPPSMIASGWGNSPQGCRPTNQNNSQVGAGRLHLLIGGWVSLLRRIALVEPIPRPPARPPMMRAKLEEKL